MKIKSIAKVALLASLLFGFAHAGEMGHGNGKGHMEEKKSEHMMDKDDMAMDKNDMSSKEDGMMMKKSGNKATKMSCGAGKCAAGKCGGGK